MTQDRLDISPDSSKDDSQPNDTSRFKDMDLFTRASARPSPEEGEEVKQAPPIRKSKPPMAFSNDGLWTSFNKYTYSAILLFMATSHFNALGFLYFALFLIHTLAYYSYRSK
jgi:hypothetical protein